MIYNLNVLLLRGLQVARPEMRNTFKCTKEYMKCIECTVYHASNERLDDLKGNKLKQGCRIRIVL